MWRENNQATERCPFTYPMQSSPEVYSQVHCNGSSAHRDCTQQLLPGSEPEEHCTWTRQCSDPSENDPVQDPAPVLYAWEVWWSENIFSMGSSSPGMEFLLNRVTTSSYGHCGLTSTSWGKKLSSTSPGWAVTTLEQKHAAALYIQKLHLQVVKVVLRVYGLVGKFLLVQQNDWAGSSLGQTYLSKKGKKKNQLNLNPTAECKKRCLKQP